MKHKIIRNRGILLIFLTFISIGCNNDAKKYPKLNTMHDEVMQVHDEVMPKISDIRKSVKQINAEIGSDYYNVAQLKELSNAIKLLEKADESMMSWMKDFKKPDYTKASAAEAYYESEMKKIAKISTMMHKSLDFSNKILEITKD